MEAGRYRYRSPQALTGVLACTVMLGCGRWGAHFGIPPLYIGDVLVAGSIVHVAVSRLLAGPLSKTSIAKRGHPGLAVGIFLGWVILRFALGGDHGIVALRDLAPYAYAAIAFLSANAYARSTADNRRRTLKFLEIALIWHLLWIIPARVINGPYEAPDDPGLHLFAARFDADGTILGITACLFLVRYLRSGGAWRLLLVAMPLGVMSSTASRAAVLATLAGLTLTLWCYFASVRDAAGRKAAMALVAPGVLIALLAVAPQTTGGSKLLASIGLKTAENSIDKGGLGSQQARREAWELIVAYARETPVRELAGVGFGPHFMLDSGASIALIHSTEPSVRSPHNYVIGTYARLGLVGTSLLALMCLQLLAGIWRVRRFAAADDLVLLAVIVPPMILVAATVGVVLEAPFGAIPFFWFLGILLAKPLPQAPPRAREEPERVSVPVSA